MISSLLAGFSRLSVRPTMSSSPACSLLTTRASTSRIGIGMGQVRHAAQLAPRRTKYKKAHKGRVPIPFGGSLKGTTLTMGEYGIRVLEGVRLSAKQLHSAQTALKRKLRVIKGSQVFMRVFPDIPVCVKGNETRMGKGKGTFEYWACRYVCHISSHML
jgi:ribosomal protein L16